MDIVLICPQTQTLARCLCLRLHVRGILCARALRQGSSIATTNQHGEFPFFFAFNILYGAMLHSENITDITNCPKLLMEEIDVINITIKICIRAHPCRESVSVDSNVSDVII